MSKDGLAPAAISAPTGSVPVAALLVMALMGFILIATETMPAGLCTIRGTQPLCYATDLGTVMPPLSRIG